MKVKQFVPEKECLSCHGCCRYSQKQTVWAPLFLFDEIVELTAKNIVPCSLFTHADARCGEAARINLVEAGGQFICPCFDPEANKCKIYAHRPFDCLLYPFLLARKGDQAYLAVDENCPYIKKISSTQGMLDYVQYLVEFFSSGDIIKAVKDDPRIVQEYPHGVKILALLPKLTGSIM
ncbi:MAG: YkgJ family cysteine cluster protein [Candidatus Omnitrophota bacterium]